MRGGHVLDCGVGLEQDTGVGDAVVAQLLDDQAVKFGRIWFYVLRCGGIFAGRLGAKPAQASTVAINHCR